MVPCHGGFPLVFLKFTAWLVLFASLGFLLIVYHFCPDQPLRSIGPALQLLVAMTALFLIARGKARAALATLIWSTLTIVTVVLAFYGGVHGTIVGIYPLIVMFGGWLFGIRSAILLAVITVMATLALLLAELWEMLPAHSPTATAMYGH